MVQAESGFGTLEVQVGTRWAIEGLGRDEYESLRLKKSKSRFKMLEFWVRIDAKV